MRLADLLLYNAKTLRRHGFRTAMLLIAMSIGVMAVNLLTGLGEGARLFVLGEFSFLGKNTLIVLPGKKETTGGLPPITGESPRDLTLNDAHALSRVAGVANVAPLIAGTSEVSFGGRSREAVTIGTNIHFFAIRKLAIKQGRMLPNLPDYQADAVCVLGATLRKELFGAQRALGQWVRAGDRRFRVVGILEDTGQSLGMDMSEIMIIPVASAQMLFNQQGLFRIFVEVRSLITLEQTKQRLLKTLTMQHEGEEDVTIVTQDALLASFDNIIRTMTLAVSGIGAISLVVAGILTMNVMLISVSQRTAEIGLIKALGASNRTVRRLFLAEATAMAVVGGLLGLLISESLLWLIRSLYPGIPFVAPWWAKVASLSVAVVTAMVFAYLPAQRAAKLAPVEALMSDRGT